MRGARWPVAALAAAAVLGAVALAIGLRDGGPPPPSFRSSDPLLNRIWALSAKTASDMLGLFA